MTGAGASSGVVTGGGAASGGVTGGGAASVLSGVTGAARLASRTARSSADSDADASVAVAAPWQGLPRRSLVSSTRGPPRRTVATRDIITRGFSGIEPGYKEVANRCKALPLCHLRVLHQGRRGARVTARPPLRRARRRRGRCCGLPSNAEESVDELLRPAVVSELVSSSSWSSSGAVLTTLPSKTHAVAVALRTGRHTRALAPWTREVARQRPRKQRGKERGREVLLGEDRRKISAAVFRVQPLSTTAERQAAWPRTSSPPRGGRGNSAVYRRRTYETSRSVARTIRNPTLNPSYVISRKTTEKTLKPSLRF